MTHENIFNLVVQSED